MIRWVSAIVIFVATGIVLAWATASPIAESDARPSIAPGSSSGAAGAGAFLGAGFGGISTESLESTALPWRLAAAALVLDERTRDPSAAMDQETLRRVMKGFGFLYPESIANLPSGIERPISQFPLGMTHGFIAPLGGSRVQVANLGCSACHAGVGYDSKGEPKPALAMLGTPNSSLNLEAYTQAVFDGFRRHKGDELLDAAVQLFPEMSRRERMTLRLLVVPLVDQRMAKLASQDRPLPFPNGSTGLTNGVAALKAQLGAPLAGGGPADDGAVSIPGLGERGWRTSLLVDGAYAPRGTSDGPTEARDIDRRHLGRLAAIITFFTVPSMGVAPEKSKAAVPEAEAIFAWLQNYRPQAFPGAIDRAAAARGAKLYAAKCASCHGSYREGAARPELVSYPNWIGKVGTDPRRADLFDEPLARKIRESAYGDMIEVRRGRGYAAPPLSGLWATAPYLHNGSVPTLAALLDPSYRPARFLVGGHALDFNAVGIRLGPDGRYPAGYRPFSTPAWYDTRSPGRSNGGHLYGAELGAADRQAMIEYLKRL